MGWQAEQDLEKLFGTDGCISGCAGNSGQLEIVNSMGRAARKPLCRKERIVWQHTRMRNVAHGTFRFIFMIGLAKTNAS